jgi:AAHS family 3-hydroxyphenylpropionic acid transporter
MPQSSAGRRAIALVFLGAIIEGFALQAAGVAAPKLGPVFGLTPEQMGVFFSSAIFGLILGALLGGMIADRYGRRASLAASLLTYGVFSIATAWATGFDMLVAIRFLTGVGLGGALPNLINIAAESAPPERRGHAVALMYAGVPLGGAIVSIVAMLDIHDDWSSIFVIGGLLPIMLVMALITMLPPLTVGCHPGKNGETTANTLLHPSTLASTLLLWFAFFCGLVVVYLLLNWLPQLLVSSGLTRDEAASVQLLFNFGGTIGGLVAGRLLDSERPTVAVTGCFTLLIVSLLTMSGLAGHFTAMLIAGGVVGGAAMCTQGLLYIVAPQCYPAQVRGRGVGLSVAVGRLGSIVGPLFAGALLARGMRPESVLYAILPVAAICGVATAILVARRHLLTSAFA